MIMSAISMKSNQFPTSSFNIHPPNQINSSFTNSVKLFEKKKSKRTKTPIKMKKKRYKRK